MTLRWAQPETQPVLVVDDDRNIRELVRLLLEEEGYRVIEAGDGQQALDQLRASSQPLVVLLDVWMPGLNGEQLLEVVEADPDLAGHTFLVMTANAAALSTAFAARLTQLQAPVLSKPFSLERLLSAVEAATTPMRASELATPTARWA